MPKSEQPAALYTWVPTSTGTPTITSTTSSTAAVGGVSVAVPSTVLPQRSLSDIENAVFAHIQAVRTLGRSQINTDEIAQGLSIPQASVIAAIARLRDKGVRVIG